MSDRASQLPATLIRNVSDVPLKRLHRAPRYDAQSARLAPGTAAQKLEGPSTSLLSMMEEPEICEYPDSGKCLAEGSLKSNASFEVIDRRAQSLDYWHGEL